MKKIVVLALSIFFLISPRKTLAVKDIFYSVKSSDEHIDLFYGESVAQTFRCQPHIGGIDLKLSGPNDSHFIFRLKSKNAESWYFEQELTNVSFANRVVYPIGFPPIEDCKEETWLFEIKSLDQDDDLRVYFNTNNPYPDGAMIIPSGQGVEKDSDLTFRITGNRSFADQLKSDFRTELKQKLFSQTTFWIFYFGLIALTSWFLVLNLIQLKKDHESNND